MNIKESKNTYKNNYFTHRGGRNYAQRNKKSAYYFNTRNMKDVTKNKLVYKRGLCC